MDHECFAHTLGQLHVASEGFPLRQRRGQVAVEVQPRLAHRHHSRVRRQLGHSRPGHLVQRPGVEVPGTVRAVPTTRMSTTSEEDKALHIALEPTGQPGDYQVDDLVHISILLEERPNVLWLPPAAIRTFEGREFVVLQEGAGQRRVDIKTGLESDDRIEITSGLTEGQIVVGQ